MPAVLAAHPPWRRLLLVSLVLPAVIVLAVLAFAWPTARTRPRDLPVGMVGSSPASQQLLESLNHARPGAFQFRLYADESSAIRAIRDRDVDGAFVVGNGRIDVLEASAASPAVAQVLSGVAAELTSQAAQQQASSVTISTTDVVPQAPDDPKGAVLSSALLPLTICSIIIAATVGVAVKFRPAWRQLVALTVVAAVAGLGTYLVAQPFLGALPHHAWADWAALSLVILAISAATTGMVALIGASGLALAAGVMVFIGNPFSGAMSAPGLLPGPVSHIGQWLPPGAGVNLLRSTAYFDGDGAAGHVGVLVTWVVVGFAAIALGHHGPIRFAASAERGGRDAEHPRHLLVSDLPQSGAHENQL